MTHDFQIDYLANHPHLVGTLARWHHNQWSYLSPGRTLEAREERLHQLLGRDAIPSVLIALGTEGLLGSAMLVAHDMDNRMDLTPWLAGVYVHAAYRCRGIGAALVRRVMQDARRLGVETLYLFTPDKKSYYQHLGWQPTEQIRYRDTDVVIMSCEL